MKSTIIIIVIFWGVIACTVIIGSNTTTLDRDNGIILEIKNEEQNADEKKTKETHKGAEEVN